VGTKKQAREAIAQEAARCGMPFVRDRWLGGTLTNFETVRRSARRLQELERMKQTGVFGSLSKKEAMWREKDMKRLAKSLDGIKTMNDLPDALFIVDPVQEITAVTEARRIEIPIVSICDTDGDGVLDKDGHPFHFTLITNQGNKMRELTATILQSHFARVGIKMDIRVLEWSAFIHNYVDKRRFDALLLAWTLSRDPDQYVIWHSSQRGEGKYNFVGYVNPVADRLWEEARTTFDFNRRRDCYHRLHRLLAEDVPYLFLYTPDALPVVHRRIQGVEVAPAGIQWNFREWRVPAALQKYRGAR
jgi:hypothetical protein